MGMNIKNILIRLLSLLERIAAYLYGKGWGGATVEKEFRAVVSLLSNSNPILCIDIGGNKGKYTEQILKIFPDCKIIIFEPAKSNVNILKDNFKNNANVTVEKFAISSKNGKQILFSDEEGSGMASLTKRRLDHYDIDFNYNEIVNTIRFEDYWINKLGSQKINFCKIDVEGHEFDVLNTFGDSINFVDVIQFEFGGTNIDTRTFFQDYWYFFKKNNFQLYRMSPLGLVPVNIYKELDEFFLITNYLAKRKVS